MSIVLVEGASTKPFETATETVMLEHIKHFEKEVTKLRTGRAHPSMVEDLKIAAYGSTMALKELGAISAPETQLLVIQPWDKSTIVDIEKGISQSDLGVTPLNDGNVIRIILPRITASRREELVKVLNKRLEEAKIAIRTVRKDSNTIIRDAEKGKKISEDYSKRLQDLLQKITDKSIEAVEKISQKKEAEILSL